ncbi:MAG: TIGR04222 domain-containing membrane protein, partial [Proteobacteria bacterium]|nr:TIGR04222 domain-containing membrane protein [Pseudomonadota bacterium]
MTTQHTDLLARLEAFNPDEPGSSLPFTARLARENDWSTDYASRVVTEYKRFVFLALTAPHVACPSEDVDQAWHLHLTYTESYWKRFCGEVLRQPLHHNPTKGGAEEGAKFRDLYTQTLASYVKTFGTLPPRDIWPDVARRFGEAEHFRRINARRNWVIPKPRWFSTGRLSFSVLAITVLAALATGCTSTLATLNIFNWQGPDFLLFFVPATVAGFILAWLRRKSLALPADVPTSFDLPDDPYVIACLTGGPVLAVNSAIASLASCQHLSVGESRGTPLATMNPLGPNPHPFERGICHHVGQSQGISLKDLRNAMKPAVELMQEKLRADGFLVPDDRVLKARLQPLLIALVLPAIGAVKIAVGLSRGKPVGILTFLCVFSFIVALIAFLRRPRRSKRGDHAVEMLQVIHGSLRNSAHSASASPTGVLMPLALGVFGLELLEGTTYAHMQKRLAPPGGNSSSGCSSSGCGGGGG